VLKGYHIKNHPDLAGPLASAMLAHTLRSWSISVNLAEYKEYVSRQAHSVVGESYKFLAQCCLGQVSEWSKRANLGTVAYFPEQGHKGFKFLSQALTQIDTSEWGRRRFNFERWAPATKSDLPTHGPDMIAHYVTAWNGAVEKSPVLLSLERKHRHIHFTGANLAAMFGKTMEFYRRLKAEDRRLRNATKRAAKALKAK
jgi:hypothetical protein